MKKSKGTGLIAGSTAIAVIYLYWLCTYFDISLKNAFIGISAIVVIVAYVLSCAKIIEEMKYGGL